MEDYIKFYYLSIETSSEYKKRDTRKDDIITITYQQLDEKGNPIEDLVILKSWESSEESILTEFMKVYNRGQFAFIPINNMMHYSLLVIARRLVYNGIKDKVGVFDYVFDRPSMDLQPIFIMGSNMSFRSGLEINRHAREKIPTLYRNKNYDEIVDLIEQKADAMIIWFKLFAKRIPLLRSNEMFEFLNIHKEEFQEYISNKNKQKEIEDNIENNYNICDGCGKDIEGLGTCINQHNDDRETKLLCDNCINNPDHNPSGETLED